MADTAEKDRAGEKPFWASLPADVRALIVSIAGTLIGGILVVLVVALAVVMARGTQRDWFLWVIALPGSLPFVAWIIFAGTRNLRLRRPFVIIILTCWGFLAVIAQHGAVSLAARARLTGWITQYERTG